MRVTLNGTRFASDGRTGSISGGLRFSREPAYSPKPQVVWNGNPYCEPGTVLYLPGFPGSGTTTYDFSGKGNHGTISNALWSQLTSGLPVLSLDGTDDYVLTPIDNTNFKPATFSLGIWIKPSSTTGTRVVMHTQADADTGISLNINQTGAGYVDGWFMGTDWRGVASASAVLSTTAFWRLILTYNLVNFTLYVNGVYNNTTATTNAIVHSANARVTLGTAWDNSADYAGLMGLVQFFKNRVLTAPEVLRDFQQTRYLFGV